MAKKEEKKDDNKIEKLPAKTNHSDEQRELAEKLNEVIDRLNEDKE